MAEHDAIRVRREWHGWEAGAKGARICRSALRWRWRRAVRSGGLGTCGPRAVRAASAFLAVGVTSAEVACSHLTPHPQGRDPRRNGVASGFSPTSHFSTPPPLSASKKISRLAGSQVVPRRRTQHPNIGPPWQRQGDSGTAPRARCSLATRLQTAPTTGSPYGQTAPVSPHCYTPPPIPTVLPRPHPAGTLESLGKGSVNPRAQSAGGAPG